MGEKWSPPELCSRRAQAVVDGGLEFLEDSMDDPTDVFDGTLELDLEMADAKDIDDGATVTGALDEIRERESQLEDAFQEIEVKDRKLYETNVTLIKEREENTALRAEIARLRAEARAAASTQPNLTQTETIPPTPTAELAAGSPSVQERPPADPAVPSTLATASAVTPSQPSSDILSSPPRLSFSVSTLKGKSSQPAFTSPDAATASTASTSTPGSNPSQTTSNSQKMYPLFQKRNSSPSGPTSKVLAFSVPPRPAPEAGG